MTYFEKRNSGFTVVELMVALGVFVVVLGIVVGGFTQSIRAQRSVAAMIAVNNNMSLTLEQIAREIRVGRNFCVEVNEANNNCNTPLFSFDPHNQCKVNGSPNLDNVESLEFQRIRGNGLAVVCYSYHDGSIWRGEGIGVCHSGNPGDLSKITAPNVNVSDFEFAISNKKSITFPWRFTIRMTVAPANNASPNMIEHIQTTVDARFLPFEEGPLSCT